MLMSGENIHPILDGSKMQTRREIKVPVVEGATAKDCKYGTVGDQLWIKETFRHFGNKFEGGKNFALVTYRQDGISQEIEVENPPVEKWWNTGNKPWKPSIFMPRWASRITLEITGIRVERLQEISEDDAKAEGTKPSIVGAALDHLKYRAGYQSLWERINGKGSWAKNPLCWVISFKKIIKL
jgi:hypothetical protein